MFDNKEKRKTTSLSDILRGLQQAVSSAVSALQAQQLNMLNDYIGHDGKPITKTVVIGGRTMEVPVMSLLSQSNMEVTDTQVDKSTSAAEATAEASAKWFLFHADINGKVSTSRENTRTTNQTAKYQIHVSASQQPPTEGLSKLMDIMASCIEPTNIESK